MLPATSLPVNYSPLFGLVANTWRIRVELHSLCWLAFILDNFTFYGSKAFSDQFITSKELQGIFYGHIERQAQVLSHARSIVTCSRKKTNKEIWSLAIVLVTFKIRRMRMLPSKYIILETNQSWLRTWSSYVGPQHMALSVMTKEEIDFRDVLSPKLICFGDSNVVSIPNRSASCSFDSVITMSWSLL